MILDNRALFSDKQVITATANSTDYYDLGLPGVTNQGIQLKRNMGKGMAIPFLVEVVETFNTLTKLDLVMQESVDAAFTAPVELFRVSVVLADLKKGYICPIDKLPRGINLQFLRMRYEVTGANPTLGKITSGVVGAVDGSYQG